MGGIVNQVAGERAAQAKDDLARYVELLEENSTDPVKVKELHSIMDRLGKSVDQVQTDAGAIRAARTIRAQIDAAKGSGKRDRDAAAAVPAFKDETLSIGDKRAAELVQLERAATRASDEHRAAIGLVSQFNKLKGENAELLRHNKPAVNADVD